jgi:hypothetical protein
MFEPSLPVVVQLPQASESRKWWARDVTQWAGKGSYDVSSEHKSTQRNDESASGGVQVDLTEKHDLMIPCFIQDWKEMRVKGWRNRLSTFVETTSL